MRIPTREIASILLIAAALCFTDASGKALAADEDDAREQESTTLAVQDESLEDGASMENENAEEEGEKEEEEEEDELPILPPIILLDFGNSTEDGNATAEEKSKRTVNGGLGYGLDQNLLQPRKYNYYFPAGKSGTTVSIEESISPFLPKTIVERVQNTGNRKGQLGGQKASFAASFLTGNGQTRTQNRNPNPNPADTGYTGLSQQTKSQPVFGSRTKPQKSGASGGSLESYRNYLTTARPPLPPLGSYAIQNPGFGSNGQASTTQSPAAYGSTMPVRYVTPGPVNFANSQKASFAYAAAAGSFADHGQNIPSNIYSHGFGAAGQASAVETSTVSAGPVNYNVRLASQHSTQQRYTVENGVRYENKVYWKYPDGRVSDTPPQTYVEYPAQSLAQRPAKSPGLPSIYEPSTTENSILSQGPVQFPIVSEQAGREPNPFVSSESLSSSLPQQQVYRLGYQNLVSQRQHVNLAQQQNSFSSSSSSSSSSSAGGRPRPGSNGYVSRYEQTTPRYMVDSPNPEYVDLSSGGGANGTVPLNGFYASPEKLSAQLPSKYTPNVQQYLDSVGSGNERPAEKQSFGGNDLNSYSNLRYSDLLSYNPSISEYVRNPASILNVRPTFVQTGNSLIPVIILRVDGASPVEPKTSRNINLKALLQQYLIQYAKSIEELAQPSTYDLGPEASVRGTGSAGGHAKSPVLDLIRLTQDDARETPGYVSDSYVGKSSYETSDLDDPSEFIGHRYTGGLNSAGQQKVKNVQILEDPRFPSYKEKN